MTCTWRTTSIIGSILLALAAIAGCSDDTTPRPREIGPAVEAAAKTCGTKVYLPSDSKVGDYKIDGTAQIATDGKSLQALIDGGSEKYEQNKFTCMSLAKYKSAAKSVTVEVWVFDQTDAAGATAAMDLVTTPDDTDISPVIGEAAKENLKLSFGYTAMFRKGKTLGRVVLAEKRTEGQADALSLLKEVGAAVP